MSQLETNPAEAGLLDVDTPAGLDLLLNRRSHHKLTGPGPSGAALYAILAAGARVPDFQRLRPFRFLIAAEEGLDRLGAALERAAIAAGQPPEVIARAPRMPHRAPMVITVVATPRPHEIVPELDQILAAGCTVMAMQLAAQALGFAGVWRSGWAMHNRALHRELDLDDADQIVGFLYLGTAVQPLPPRSDDDPSLLTRWL